MYLRRQVTAFVDRANKLASQFYTPRELRALLAFLLLGIAILLFRSGKSMYLTWFPEKRDSREVIERKKQDSLFFALSRVAKQRDSLFFSLPEDSLLPNSVRIREQHHSKTDGLRLGSISLNHGSKEELARLPGVGPMTAERIMEYRSERGGFRSLEELKNVRGVGSSKYEAVKRFLRLE